nr:HD-GYP domain-containing protein [Deinobacterium chartae]
MASDETASRRWYGLDEVSWRSGIPRVLRGKRVAARSRSTSPAADHPDSQRFFTAGRAHQICANLCVPVVLEGAVLAHLNLDSLTCETAFDEEALEVAAQFAVQVAALLAERRRREREAARRYELEVLAWVSAALQAVTRPDQAEGVLAEQASALLGSEHALYLRYDPEQDRLRPGVALGDYRQLSAVELDRGEEWAASGQDPELRDLVPPGYDRALCAPLRSSTGALLGALLIAREGTRPFENSERRLLRALASVGSASLERLSAVGALEQRACELAQGAARFEALLRLSQALESSRGVGDVARHAVEALAPLTGVCCLTLWQISGRVATPLAFYGEVPPAVYEVLARPVLLEHRLAPLGSTRLQPVYLERTPIADHARAGVRGVALFTLPGSSGSEVLAAYRLETRPWTPGECALLEVAVRSIAAARERVAYVQQIEATREGALLTLGVALEARDLETRGHTERVVSMATGLGRALGLGSERLEALRQGAYLHDIGKLAVPDRVLLKPGPLTAAERLEMQMHVTLGFERARCIPSLPPEALDVILYHHERWDGSGYPSGLFGEDIPLLARVFSVVDVFDALTSSRPYKEAWSVEAALEELGAQAGRQFDPCVVEVFVRWIRTAGIPEGGAVRSDPVGVSGVRGPAAQGAAEEHDAQGQCHQHGQR